ncbi:MAG: sugar phosphate nucleotidyltransferase [Patescibacteria group bacterium]|mgnify:CR=1 FL=1
MKGIVLAGGKAKRLMPLTKITSKQLLPVYNKPMIFYPLGTLLRAGIKEILIIIAPDYAGHFLNLLGSGRDFGEGVKFTFEIQDHPKGLADAFIIGESFIDDDAVTMILGDNIIIDDVSEAIQNFRSGGRIFAKKVADPERFGVVEFDASRRALSIVEKPQKPASDYAVTGIYIYDSRVVEFAKKLVPSARGELEITDINNIFLKSGELDVRILEKPWFDAGTFDSLLAASHYISEESKKK